MIKCCQNCHYFRKGADVCESGEVTVMDDELMGVLCEDYNLRYIQDLYGLAKVQIKDPQNFCCNAWR